MGVVAGRAAAVVVKEQGGGVSKPSGGGSTVAPSRPAYDNKAVVYVESKLHAKDTVRINFSTGAVFISCATLTGKEKPMRVFKSLLSGKSYAYPQVAMGDGVTVNFTDAASFKIDTIGNASSASISLEVLSNSGGSMAITQQPSKSNGFTAEFQVTGRQWRGGFYTLNVRLSVK
ncbi:hypothetical protein ZK97_13510 [Salmonella enterica subsp. enterica serovar Enteritidis]|nr:hypothetical protein [Salmonella enterica subsp. enterica serovar Enteritidis]